jgi:PucR C-terminal helix-turn-helix domain
MGGQVGTAASGDRLRHIISAEMAAALRPQLRDIAREMAREIEIRVPEYARISDSGYAQMVLLGSDRTLSDFISSVSDNQVPVTARATDVFEMIGRGEARLGRSLDALHAAMHIGAEVIWRRLSECCMRLGMSDQKLCQLAEALLLHFRQNTSAAAEGYAAARTRLADEVHRRQRHLLELLLSDPPVSPDAVAKVASAAKWKIPETVAVVVLRDRGTDDFSSLDLPTEILVDLSRSEPCLVVPDPGKRGRTRTLDLALRGWMAVVGPPLPVADAAKSLRWARQAIALAERGLIRSAGVIHCVDHLSTLVIFQNEELIDTLATLRLAPLGHLRPVQRDRLAETLLAWLQAGGDAGEVAAQLHIHPQTVRYRLRQLHELFGERLRDPDVRLQLEVVLRARQLSVGAHPPTVQAPLPV